LDVPEKIGGEFGDKHIGTVGSLHRPAGNGIGLEFGDKTSVGDFGFRASQTIILMV